jgi:hypothetical protein
VCPTNPAVYLILTTWFTAWIIYEDVSLPVPFPSCESRVCIESYYIISVCVNAKHFSILDHSLSSSTREKIISSIFFPKVTSMLERTGYRLSNCTVHDTFTEIIIIHIFARSVVLCLFEDESCVL